MKDELARDKAMDKLVGAQVRASLKPAGADCLSAESIAAYVEHTLGSGERSRCESHLASCARCQEHVAALVRLGEADEPIPAKAVLPARAPKHIWFRWLYAGPIFAALLVAGIYVLGPFREIVTRGPEIPTVSQPPVSNQTLPPANHQAGKVNSSPEIPPPTKKETQAYDIENRKSASPSEDSSGQPGVAGTGVGNGIGGKASADHGARNKPEALPEPPKPARAEDQVTVTAPTNNEAVSDQRGMAVRSREIATPSVRSDLAKTRDGGSGANAGVVPGASAGGVANPTPPPTAQRLKDDHAGGPPPQAPETSAKSAKELDALQRNEKKAKAQSTSVSNETVEVQDQDNKRPPTTTQSVVVTGESRAVAVNAAISIPTWRVGRHGLIEEKDANGNWVKRNSGVKTNLKAISFPNPDVGWAAGDDGIILRSTDGGTTWSAIHSPTSDRIVQVTASSDMSATIVTRKGETYSTSDGGQNWTSPPEN